MAWSGQSAGEAGTVWRSSGRRAAARGGVERQLGSRLELPVPEKTTTPATSRGRHGGRNGLGKSREERGEGEEARGEVFLPFRALEETTHLGGFRPAGRRLWRRVAACWVVGVARGSSLVSEEDDDASRSELGRPEEDLVRPSSACSG